MAVVILAAVVFLAWRSLVGLLVARIHTGLGLGAAAATATAGLAVAPGMLAASPALGRAPDANPTW
jgi:hypothetical protein